MATHNTGGGIDTQNLSSAVVTHVTGSDAKPVREEELRNRFLTFDPIFDRHGHVVARELVLRGVILAQNLPVEIQRMNEDMLLTGLYSLIQDGLTGEQPLLVQVSHDVLFSDALPQLNRPGIIWVLTAPDAGALKHAQNLAKTSSMQFCLDDITPETVQTDWAFYRFDMARAPTAATGGQIIIRNIGREHELAHWPESTWFMGEYFTGQRMEKSAKPDVDLRLELATVAARQSLSSLIQFMRLNPSLEPQMLRIAHSAAGGLSQKTDSSAHAMIRLGWERAQRVGILTALAGGRITADNRLYAQVALSRSLLMGKLGLLSPHVEDPGQASEAGLFSTFPAAFSLSVNQLYRRIGLQRKVYESLAGQDTPIKKLLHLAHACEHNQSANIASLAKELEIPLESISSAHLESLVAAEDMGSQFI